MKTIQARCAALGVLIAVLLPLDAAAATPAPVPAAAPVTLSGRVFTPEGTPASGVQVTLSRDIGVASTIGGLLGTVFTFGLACIYHDVKLCQNNSYPATTRPDGTYGIALPGEVGSVTLREHNKFNFAVSLPPGAGETSGPSATATFNVSQAHVVIPDVHLWRAAVKVTGDKLHGHIAFTATNPPVSAYNVGFSAQTGTTIYSTTTSGPSADFDARLLEDAQGSASVTANAAGPAGGDVVSLTYRSPSSAFTGTAGPPPSRGKPCAYQQGDKPPAPINPCPLTDGDFATPFTPAAACPAQATGAPCPQSAPASCLSSPLPARPSRQDLDRQRQANVDCVKQRQGALIIDMGSPSSSIGMVVVRGGSGNLSLQTSTDGQHWSAVGSQPTGSTPAVTTLPAGVHARYVRLGGAFGVPNPAEVSIWPSLLRDPGPLGLGTLFGAGGSGGLHLPQPNTPGGFVALWLIVLVLAGAVGAGAYFGVKAASTPRPGPTAPPPAA